MIPPAGPSGSPSFLDKIKSGAKFLKEVYYDQTRGKISLLAIPLIVGSVLTFTGIATIPGIIILSLTAAAGATAWGASALKANKVATQTLNQEDKSLDRKISTSSLGSTQSSDRSTQSIRSASPTSRAASQLSLTAEQEENFKTLFLNLRKDDLDEDYETPIAPALIISGKTYTCSNNLEELKGSKENITLTYKTHKGRGFQITQSTPQAKITIKEMHTPN